MNTRLLGTLALAVSVPLVISGCGEGSNLVQGDTVINNPSNGGGNNGGNNGGDNGGDNGGNNGGDNGGTPVAGAFFDTGGFLQNQNIHPLMDNIDPVSGSPDITPATPVADQASCPEGTSDPDSSTVNSVTLFGDNDYFQGGSTNPVFPVCVIDANLRAQMDDSGNPIATEYTLTNDHIYLLTIAMTVGNGQALDTPPAMAEDVTLNIEAGTQIYGQEGGGENGTSIRITRGASINAMGTLEQPIIMAAVDGSNSGNITGDVTDLTGLGDWGGLVINGYGLTNNTDAGDGGDGTNSVPNERRSEAAPVGQNNFYGGDIDDDNSGTLTYVVIGETGTAFAPNEEVQGLTLEAVGSGTTINNIQVFASDDDGIEFFGGSVNLTGVVINGMSDDGLDIDQGYSGTIQKAIVRQGSERGDRGSEQDGSPSAVNFDIEPVTRPVFANILFLGDGDEDSSGLLMREGVGTTFENVAIVDMSALSSANGGSYGVGCFDNVNEVDTELQARGIAFYCANSLSTRAAGEVSSGSDLFANVWSQGNFDENGGANDTVTGIGDTDGGFVATEDSTMTVDGDTYLVTTAVSPAANVDVAGAYIGAVSSEEAQMGNEFWRGWTVSLANQ